MESVGLVPAEHREHIRAEFNEKLENPVRLIVFSQQIECRFCSETRQLAQELAALNIKIAVEVYDFVSNADKVAEFGIERIPALAVVGQKDYGIRFYGFPYGFEFQTLIESIVNVSRGRTDLSDQTKQKLMEVKAPAHIKIFVTLTCPHCSAVAIPAEKFAIENGMIKVDIIDAGEFPDLALKYTIVGVPKTVINEKVDFIGALPEDLFLEHILLATV
jgi:glutaredoxin-like protein